MGTVPRSLNAPVSIAGIFNLNCFDLLLQVRVLFFAHLRVQLRPVIIRARSDPGHFARFRN
jgi:hypothetical protein